MKIFHDKGVKHVVLTSLTLPDYDDLVMLASEKGKRLKLVGSIQLRLGVTFNIIMYALLKMGVVL